MDTGSPRAALRTTTSIPDAAVYPAAAGDRAPIPADASLPDTPFGLPSGGAAAGWYRLPRTNRDFGVFLERTAAPSTTLVVHWGRGGRSGPAAAAPRQSPRRGSPHPSVTAPGSSSPTVPVQAAVARERRSDRGTTDRTAPRPRAAITAPVSFTSASLGALLTDPRNAAVVDPFLFAAMPCAPLPRLALGVVSAPHLLVEVASGPNLIARTSPFRGIDDLSVTFIAPVQRAHASTAEILVGWALPDPRYALWPSAATIRD